MFSLNFKSSKNIFFLDIFLYFIPFSILLGTFVLNIFTIISSVIFLFLFISKKISVNIKYLNLSISILVIFLILNNVFSIDIKTSIPPSLNLMKSFLTFLALYYCIINLKNFKKNFFVILFFTFIFVVCDTYFQHFFEKDIFGYEVGYSNGRRLSGPFGDEFVVGAYLSKLFFLTSLLLIIFYKSKYFYILMFLTFGLVIFSNERSASIMLFCGIFIYFLFCNINIRNKLFAFIAMFVFLLSIFSYNENLKNHFITIPVKYFKDNHHKAHFLAAIEIFKNNIIFGSGIRTFRIECRKEKYSNIKTIYANKRCTTHPHNIYLEILSESGVFGFMMIFTLNLYILINLIKNFFRKKSKYLKQIILIVFCNFFILFSPLQTTGAFFSSFSSIFYVYFYAIFFSFNNELINHTD